MDFGDYKPIIPANAEALVDFALSFIPESIHFFFYFSSFLFERFNL